MVILLQEDGDDLLLETGVSTDNILLESQVAIVAKAVNAMLAHNTTVNALLHKKSVNATIYV